METKKPKPNVFIVPSQVVGEVGLERACIIATDGRLKFDLAKSPSKRAEEKAIESVPPKILTESELDRKSTV